MSDLEAKNNEAALLRASLNKSHEILSGLSTKISELEKQRREAVDKSNKEQSEISTTINDLKKDPGRTSNEAAKRQRRVQHGIA